MTPTTRTITRLKETALAAKVRSARWSLRGQSGNGQAASQPTAVVRTLMGRHLARARQKVAVYGNDVRRAVSRKLG